MTIEINCDMGEGFGLYKMGDDSGLMEFISVANVACGFHASDPQIMLKTVTLAKEHQVKVGAHPSYPDKQGFGRRYIAISMEELRADLIYQIGALKGFLDTLGMPLNHIKPHGALYGRAAIDKDTANVLCDVALNFNVPLYGLAGTVHEEVYRSRGVEFVGEFYADLDYGDQGELIITKDHHSLDPQAVKQKIQQVIEQGTTQSVNGKELPIVATSICVHSDTPNAIDVARAVQQAVAQFQAVR